MSEDQPSKPGKRLSRRQREERRRFLRSAGLALGTLGAALLGLAPVLGSARARLRPPGAIAENELLSACIKCGQCVQVCPVQAIKLADLGDGFGVGVPYLDARAQACDFSCDAVQCVLACPTGALSHEISAKEQVRTGIARLTHPEACLARQGNGVQGPARGYEFRGLHRYMAVDRWNPIRVSEHPYNLELCDLCVRECPIEHAITLVPLSGEGWGEGPKRATPVVQQACVGCGMCEMICPAEPSAIVIEERKTWGSL